MNLKRKFVPALALLLISAVMVTTATFAWFSMNTRVTATGMQMETEAGDNVLIANDTSTTQAAPASFGNALTVSGNAAKLRPVSTVNGKDFYYVKGLQVNGAGGASAPDGYAPYVAYDHTNLTNFKQNYRTNDNIVGYTEYAFQVMATNAEGSSAKALVIDTLSLTYAGSAGVPKAFRVAVFADEFTGSTVSGETLVTILKNPDAAYFTSSNAVNGVNSTGTVSNPNQAAVLGNLPAGATKTYRVVVRVWLEGEDTTCTNSTFAALDASWSLDLAISLGASDGSTAVKTLNGTSATLVEIPAATYTVGSTVYPVDATAYYPVLNGEAMVSVPGMANAYLFTTTTGAIDASGRQFFALTYDATYQVYQYPVNVTPRYTVVPAVDLTSATAVDATETNVELDPTPGEPASGDEETYYAITGKTLRGEQLYAKEAGAIASDTVIYTIKDGAATEATAWCTLPAPSETP